MLREWLCKLRGHQWSGQDRTMSLGVYWEEECYCCGVLRVYGKTAEKNYKKGEFIPIEYYGV